MTGVSMAFKYSLTGDCPICVVQKIRYASGQHVCQLQYLLILDSMAKVALVANALCAELRFYISPPATRGSREPAACA